jgi:tRNA threonylcarbamoyl adenosine modification protein YeaZ
LRPGLDATYRGRVQRVLAIECSAARASLAVVGAEGTRFEESYASDRRHHARIFATLQRALATLDGDPLDEIVVGTGPGSYNGVRVAIAAADAVAMVLGCQAVGLTSLLGLGLAHGTVVGDARRRSAWTADLSEPLPRAQLVSHDRLADRVGTCVWCLEPDLDLPLPSTTECRRVEPSASRLAAAWLALDETLRQAQRQQTLEPIYLRPPHITPARPGHPLLRPKS